MIFEKFKQLTTDRTVKAMIGMSRDKFDRLVVDYAQAFRELQLERVQTKEIKRLPAGGGKSVFNNHEKRLFFLLFYLKTYPTFDVLGFHFGLSAGHAHDYVAAFMPVLQRALDALEAFPQRTFETVEDFQQAIEKYSEIAVDGVEMSCVRPRDAEQPSARYSGKKSAIP